MFGVSRDDPDCDNDDTDVDVAFNEHRKRRSIICSNITNIGWKSKNL